MKTPVSILDLRNEFKNSMTSQDDKISYLVKGEQEHSDRIVISLRELTYQGKDATAIYFHKCDQVTIERRETKEIEVQT